LRYRFLLNIYMSCDWQLGHGHCAWELAAGKPRVVYSVWSEHSDRQTKSQLRIASSSKASFSSVRSSCSYLQVLVLFRFTSVQSSNVLIITNVIIIILVNIVIPGYMYRAFANKKVVTGIDALTVSRMGTMKMMVPCDG
jgi:hypothetical protein